VATGMRWSVYGIAGIWILIQPNNAKCSPAGSTAGRQLAVAGEGVYNFNVNEFKNGGYKIFLRVKRNDGAEVDYNEKYMCIATGGGNPPPNPTSQPQPTGVPPTPIPPPAP
jgi:hypothetical protein